MSAITGGIQLHPKTGQPYILLSEEDMKEVKALQRAGFGQHDLPQGALNALIKQRRSSREDIGDMTPGQRWERWHSHAQLMLKGAGTREERDAVARGQMAMRQKFVNPGDVHNDAFLTTAAVQYANDAYIGDQLCPVVMVSKKTGEIPAWDKRNRLAAPDDTLNDYDEANEVKETRRQTTYTTVGRGLQNSVPATTIANQDAPYDEMLDLTASVSELMALRREIRQATLLTTNTNYAAGNTAAVAAADRWNTAGGGDPIANMQTADAALWTGRGPSDKLMFSSLNVYNVLSRHPDILSLFIFGGTAPGLASPGMIARWLGAVDYLVGRARYDTANEGQTESYSRIWSDVWGLVRVAKTTTVRNAWFAATLRWNMTPAPPGMDPQMGWATQQWYDPKPGIGGAYYAKVATCEVQQVIASDTGYLWTTPIN